MSERRYTAKDAERQMAWLAKDLGKRVHYIYLDGTKDAEDIARMAESATGNVGVGAWVLHNAGGNRFCVHQYEEHGESTPLGHDLYSARDFWDVCYFARRTLAVAREQGWSVFDGAVSK